MSNVTSATEMGALIRHLDNGRTGAWTGEFKADAYWLENRGDIGAIRYYFGDYDSDLDGSRRIGVDIRLADTAPGAGAGLLYGYDQNTGNYYLIMLSRDGVLRSFRRDENGVNEIMSSGFTASPSSQRLEIVERGTSIELFVNALSIGSFESSGTGRGATGIAAMGVGRFGFDQYHVTSTSQGFTQRVINDEFGFEQTIPAYSLSLPADWTLKGAVQWHGVAECPIELSKVHFMATAPSGAERIELIPGGAWTWMSLYDSVSSMRQRQGTGCAVKRILDMQSFINAYIPSIRPDAKITLSRPRPELARKIVAHAQGALDGRNGPINVQVHEVELQYEADGKTINEVLLSTVVFSQVPGADPYGGMRGWMLMAQDMGTITMAKVGAKPDRALLEKIADSMQMLPDYQGRLQQFIDRRSQQMAAAAQRRRVAQQQYLASRRAAAASRRSTSSASSVGSDILDIQFNGWKSRNTMTSAGQSRAVDGIHDRTAYNNTGGQIVYMPTTHSRMYQLPNDVYVGTNDQFFNPLETTGQFGEELGAHRYGW